MVDSRDGALRVIEHGHRDRLCDPRRTLAAVAQWPSGRALASGRDLDVIALANERLRSGQPRLAEVYGDAAATDPDNQT
jgi:hypothetical protein